MEVKYSEKTLQESKSKYCLCIFVINEGEKLLKQLKAIQDLNIDLDIIIADGGSDDGTTDEDKLKQLNVSTLLVKLSAGKLGSQMQMGFDWAHRNNYQGVILMDGNGKDDPVALHNFIQALDQGFDHIQGSRFIPGGKSINLPRSRWFGLKFIHIPTMRLASGFSYTDTTNGFRAYSMNLIKNDELAIFRNCFSGYELHYYIAIMASKYGLKMTEVPTTRAYPPKGKVPTKISPIKGNLGVIYELFKTSLGFYNNWPRFNLTFLKFTLFIVVSILVVALIIVKAL